MQRRQLVQQRRLRLALDGRRPSFRPFLASFGIVVVADGPSVLLAIGYGPVGSGHRMKCTSASSRTA